MKDTDLTNPDFRASKLNMVLMWQLLAYDNRLFSLSDIDECRDNPQICGSHAICNNQPGTFRCECEDGYQFANDGQTCIGKSSQVHLDIPEIKCCSWD